ncbi:hypothetical protein KKF34_09570 [Myxococcota bacterium]|nr:hypothetical protein [Myxococcota bacterium]MBU1497112.1 hypothetical protein [Myxococcota bacterium]
MKNGIYIIILLIAVGCKSGSEETNTTPSPRTPEANQKEIKGPGIENETVEKAAEKVITLLKEKNFAALASYVHKERGVRFSPFQFIDTKLDRIIKHDAVSGLFSDKSSYIWGMGAGSGEPIKMNFESYFKQYVWDLDFTKAPKKSMNKSSIGGSMTNNLREIYPTASFMEYYYDRVSEKYDGMDWRGLTLVFEKTTTGWFLTGIIHSQWTP